MDSKSEENDDVSAIKQMRANLETRIGNQRLSQQQRIASLQTLVPGLVSSIDLSLKVVSDFNGLHYTPTPIPPTPISQNPNPIAPNPQNPNPKPPPNLKPKPLSRRLPSKPVSMIGNPLSVVRSMVAVCLLERVPFMPIDSATVLRKLESDQSATEEEKAALLVLGGDSGGILSVEKALRSIGDDKIGVELDDFVISGTSRVMVLSIDRNRLVKEFPESCRKSDWKLNSGDDGNLDFGGAKGGDSRMGSKENSGQQMHSRNLKRKTVEDLIEEMLNKKSVKELKSIQTGEEILDLINRPTAKETTVIAKFKTKGGSQVKEYCPLITKDDCRRHSGSYFACEKVHYTRLIAAHTDISLGQCSFLNACRHMKTCKHIHYEIDLTEDVRPIMMNDPPPKPIKIQRPEYCSEVELGHPQWINCDIRTFRMDILGQFGVIMADPPWDIHMQLPYGTMADDEMRALNISGLQTDGLIFLWVTGRAMELGRECLDLWGYKCIEEIIWVKTNQLQRIIRTGRTGHWLNHSKEHCLVGIKGNPEVIRNIDTDVIVAEVRETSRKPDEMYPLLERISPRTRKLELFARTNNLHAGWISLGNQLKGVRLVDEGLRARFKAAYPEVEVEPKSPPRTPALEIE